MPYALNRGVRFNYQVEGAGPPLVLHHGTFGSLEDWREFGYVDALGGVRQLILIDARGHGMSDKPYDPAAYDLAERVRDVTCVLDDLGIDRADYFGFSLGGWIGFGLAMFSPTRVGSLVLGGAHPYAENMQAFRDLMPQTPTDSVALLRPFFGPFFSEAMRTRLLSNDLQALRCLTQDRDSMAEVLPTIAVPTLLFVGDADPRLPRVRQCAEAIVNCRLLVVPDSGHVVAHARSDVVLPQVMTLLSGR